MFRACGLGSLRRLRSSRLSWAALSGLRISGVAFCFFVFLFSGFFLRDLV